MKNIKNLAVGVALIAIGDWLMSGNQLFPAEKILALLGIFVVGGGIAQAFKSF
jgi:hypothetical protein